MPPLRIGFIGLGGICRQRHLPGLQKIDDVEFVAVANRSRESGEAAATEFGIPEVCDTWTDIIKRNDIDAVFIGTWPYMHHPISMAALEAGKHVFCQARMAMNVKESKEMYAAAQQAGRVAMLCPVPFGLSVDRTVARILQAGTLGDVRFIQVQSLSGMFSDPETPMSWRKDHRYSGLNALTVGMYIEVIHRWFGWTESVSAQLQTVFPKRPDEMGQETAVKIPDQFFFNTLLESGLLVQYGFSGVVRQGKDFIDIHGTESKLHYDVLADVLYQGASDDTLQPVEIHADDAYDAKAWRVEQDFVDAIRKKADYHPNFEDGLRYMQVVEALYSSAAQERTVHLSS